MTEEVTSAVEAGNTENTEKIESTPESSGAPEVSTPESTGNTEGNTGNTEASTETTEDSPKEEADSKDWFMRDKFATETDQAKAYTELSKKMGTNWGAPKEGGYKLPEGIEGQASDDPLIERMTPCLKELGISNDGFAKLYAGFQDSNLKMVEEMTAKVKKEITENDAQTVGVVDKWMTDKFSPEDKETLQSWIQTTGDFNLLNKLRVMIPSTNVPSSMGHNAISHDTLASLEAEKIKNYKEYSKDGPYRRDLSERYKAAALRESMK